jgi:hypothetical protein
MQNFQVPAEAREVSVVVRRHVGNDEMTTLIVFCGIESEKRPTFNFWNH